MRVVSRVRLGPVGVRAYDCEVCGVLDVGGGAKAGAAVGTEGEVVGNFFSADVGRHCAGLV